MTIWINGRQVETDGDVTPEIRISSGATLKIDDGTDLEVEGSAFSGLAELAALSAAEVGLLDGAGTGGTPVASKVQVADANQNIGAVKATGLSIGTSGSETAISSTAAELNILDGVTATASELNALDISATTRYFEDFNGGTLPTAITKTTGSGTGNAVAMGPAGSSQSRMYIASASDDGAITDNASAIELGGKAWSANSGGLIMEVRLTCTDISEAYIFVGFTDALPSAGLEQPIFLNGADIDSDATNACGVLYDVDGTTEQWCHGGVKADADTAPAYSGAAPVQNTYETIRVAVSSSGGVTGSIDGTAIGAEVANAVTASTALYPVVVVANRSANQVLARLDYMLVESTRV